MSKHLKTAIMRDLAVMLTDVGIAKVRHASHVLAAAQWQEVVELCTENIGEAMQSIGLENFENEQIKIEIKNGELVIEDKEVDKCALH